MPQNEDSYPPSAQSGEVIGAKLTTSSLGQPNLIPEKYRRLVRTVETNTPVGAGYVFPSGLTGDQTFVELAQKTIQESRRKIIEEIINVGSSLVGSRATEFLQTATVTETIVNDTDPAPTLSATVIAATKDPLGNGKSIQIVATVPDVFDAKSRQIGTPLVIPERFRAASGVNTKEDTIAGTVPSTVSLAAGEVERNESQQTKFTKRVKTTEFDAGAAPTLHGQEYDQQFDIVVPYVDKLEVAGTSLGNNRKDITPLSDALDLVKTVDPSAIAAILASYSLSFPGTANLDLPDQLTALTGLMETNSHAGEYINDIAYGEAIDHGTWSVNVRGEGSGGGQIMPDLRIDIRQTYARNVATTHYIFFLPSPVTAAAFLTKLAALVGASISAWPKFKPQLHTFTLVGRSLDLTANVDGQASQGFDGEPLSYSAGHGTSRRSGMNIRTVRLPPTIHGSVSVGTDSQTLNLATVEAHSVVGSAFPGLDEDVVLSGEAIAALITPSSLSATAGASTIPTTGKYLLESQSEIYKYGYVRCHAEVLDFSDV